MCCIICVLLFRRANAFQKREDHYLTAKNNISHIPELRTVITLHNKGIDNEGFEERDVDAVILDTRESERYLSHAHKALKPGGMLACIVATTNQVCTYELQ